MDRSTPRSVHRRRPVFVRPGWVRALPILLALGLASQSHAESALQTAPSSGRSLNASARLDIRVTVLPVLALTAQASGLRIQGNGGVLTVQRDLAGQWDGRAPSASTQVRPQGRVIDTAVLVSRLDTSDLITIASP